MWNLTHFPLCLYHSSVCSCFLSVCARLVLITVWAERLRLPTCKLLCAARQPAACCRLPAAVVCAWLQTLFVFLTARCRGCLMLRWTTPPDTIALCVFVCVSCYATSRVIPPQPNHKRPHITDYLYPIAWNYINSLCRRCFVAFFFF